MHFWETVQRIGLKSCSYKYIFDWIYVNMASMSRYWSSAKYVLGTKDPISPTKRLGGCLRISLSSTIIVIAKAGWGKGETRYLPVKASSKHCSLLKDFCQNRPPTHPLLGLSLGYLPAPTKTASLLNFWRPNWLPAPGENLFATF